VPFYSSPSFLSTGILGGSTAKNKKQQLCVLGVSAVKKINITDVMIKLTAQAEIFVRDRS